MSGRGDNNKRGSSGAGASNQSGQAVPPEEGKMNHGKQTGGQPSTPMGRGREQDAQRNTSIKDHKGERS
ncbi:hypothetical protein [Flaviaesturariibacter aridisoli]|uniref:Uncharacterized protein n=1 Tax=Flaviaesturariibacter aridisoli TaxID=2545761 RepID=A0A4R4E5A2_9BACT|nr:hypothetical protein [Flaviaesturariibacter aridisoli]TCZ73910.1 hypothetical protein E0486_04315 [Flaviaesturariibacter aridisoli]